MDFSSRSAQSCSCHVTGAGATGVSSPIRTNEAMSAPPERNFKVARPESHSSAPGASNELMPCDWLGPQNNRSIRIRVTPVLLNYRRLRVDGQRLRCRIESAALSNGNTSRPFQNPVNEGAQGLRQRLGLRNCSKELLSTINGGNSSLASPTFSCNAARRRGSPSARNPCFVLSQNERRAPAARNRALSVPESACVSQLMAHACSSGAQPQFSPFCAQTPCPY